MHDHAHARTLGGRQVDAELHGVVEQEGRPRARDLKKLGWRSFGPTTAYAFMQAMGLVNHHLEGCPVRERCEEARAGFFRPG